MEYQLEIAIDSNCPTQEVINRKKGASLDKLELRFIEQIKKGISTVWTEYNRIIVAFSGGKDSLAAVLYLLDLGCPREKLELWHHEIDGREQAEAFMDWPSTPDYCRAVADELGLPLRFSWRQGGFLGEVMKEDAPAAPVKFELPEGHLGTAGGKGKPATRRKFPAISASLMTRWCSALLKIDVADFIVRGDDRFQDENERYLLITGERREESANRAKYAETEYHRTACRRRNIIHWRAVIDWTEAEIWERIEKHKINPHPCYQAGFGRCSCAFCIFGNPSQFAAGRSLLPEQFDRIVEVEEELGFTLRQNETLTEWADKGKDFTVEIPEEIRRACASTEYILPVRTEAWELPNGAFKEQGGPI
jgi:3'-phosphoadenosine 5'-phosphosulfate sulfotransferase (PAPS reductase)/FAD synthetase